MGQTYPTPISKAMVTPPYVPVFTTAGGAFGDDVDTATATAVVDDRGKGDYAPRTQAAKAAATIAPVQLTDDVARPRGWIAPGQPYSYPKPAAPVITSLTPNTVATAGAKLPIAVKITGTGFTVWSSVFVGVGSNPVQRKFISATEMWIDMHPEWSTPGVVPVVVVDHNVKSVASDFTFT